MAVAKLNETSNFGEWLDKVNEIIDNLGAESALADALSAILASATEGNQTNPWLLDPSGTVTYPDGSTASASEFLSYNWNDYVRNGVFWIPWNASATANAPMGRQAGGACWVASVSSEGPVVQIGVTMESAPAAGIRYGSPAGDGSVSWNAWRHLADKQYVDDTFLNRYSETLQDVAGPVEFISSISADKNAAVKGDLALEGIAVLGAEGRKTIVNPSAAAAGSQDISRYLSVEVSGSGSSEADRSFNLPLWSLETGEAVPLARRNVYKEPFWIDKEERTANINGTAEYARNIVPGGMASKFKSWEIPYSDMWKPVSAQALAGLFDWTRSEFAAKSGAVFTGVVRHENDIFLDHVKGIQENRTAAIRSTTRPLNLQCQGITHVISNSKQASLYLEKEDADSAEFTTDHHDASFAFRKIVPDPARCREDDPSFRVLNSNPEQDGFYRCHSTYGTWNVEISGHWKFTADQRLLEALEPGQTLKARIYYSVVNAVNGTRISSACEYTVSYGKGDGQIKEGTLDINDKHFQIAVTDTDWTGMPIVKVSTLAQGCRLADGSLIAAGSVINGIRKEEDEIVYGLQTAYGVKEGSEETQALLASGSILSKGSLIVSTSRINGADYPFDVRLQSDVAVVSDSTLAKGCIVRSGSYIALNSVVNGFQYLEGETVKGQEIAEESTLAPGSKILVGSLVSTASQLNGIPGKSGFLEVLYGINAQELDAPIALGSILLEGTVVAAGSSINGEEVAALTELDERISVTEASSLRHGSKIAAGSLLAAGSIVNGLRWMNPMRTPGSDSVEPLALADIAPILYVREYDNLQNRWSSGWTKQSFRSVYPNMSAYDRTVWQNWLWTQIDAMDLKPEQKALLKDDLEKSLLDDPDRSYPYPLRENANTLIESGSYTLDKSSPTAPNAAFDTRCYVFAHSKQIGVERILVQPCRPILDESGRRTGLLPVHDPVEIYASGESRKPDFQGEAFRYFNFIVQPSGSGYAVYFDTQLVPEQWNLDAGIVSEVLKVLVYADSSTESGAEEACVEKIVSANVSEMMGAPFVFGARTRTGITDEGELGDLLYDLGAVEITEDSLSLKIRKRSVSDLTPSSEVKQTLALNFERFPAGDTTAGWRDTIAFRPSSTDTVDLGTGEFRFKNVYLASEPIVSSDRNLKAEIADFPEALLNKWAKVKWVSFKFKDSIERKGQRARTHSGVVAQDVANALKGVKLANWSFFCRDKWDERRRAEWREIPAHTDEFGIFREARMEREEVVEREAGEQYSIRYQEMQCIENAYLRREIESLKKEVAELKKALKQG